MSAPLMPPGTMPRRLHGKKRDAPMTMDLAAVREGIEGLLEDFRPFHDACRLRAQFYHRSKEVNPKLPDWLQEATPYQSPILGKTGEELHARLNENKWATDVQFYPDIARLRENANKLEQVFEQGESVSIAREQGDLQSGLAMGLIQKAFGAVLCVKGEHVVPDMPDHEMLEPMALPSDPKEAKRYAPLYRGPDEPEDAESSFPYMLDDTGNLAFGGDGLTPMARPISHWRETDEALQDRYRYDCARAGWPWHQEVLDPCSIAFKGDRSGDLGPAELVIVRELPLSKYLARLRAERKDGHKILSLNEADEKIPIHALLDAPGEHEPSHGTSSSETVRVYQYWTRDEFYEVLGGTGGSNADGTDAWEIIKKGKHQYERVPVFFAYARLDLTTTDPVNRYRPALDDLYALIAQFNRQWTLQFAIAEMNALPYFYWKRVADGEPLRDTSGSIQQFTRNAADAAMAPDGYELAQIEVSVSPEFMKSLEMLDAAITAMTPSTGQAEIETGTQPWTARMDQAQKGVVPTRYLNSMAEALRQMRRMQTHVMSLEAEDGGFAQPVVVFSRKDNGRVNLAEMVFLEPKDIRSLNVDVKVDATSAQERITKEMHGLELHFTYHVITKAQLLEDYMGIANPDEHIRKLDEEELFETYIKPGQMKQMLITGGFLKVEMGPDGQFYDSTGMPVMPEEVLARNGQMPPQGGQPTGPNSPMPPQMGDLPGMAAPNTIPLGGLAG